MNQIHPLTYRVEPVDTGFIYVVQKADGTTTRSPVWPDAVKAATAAEDFIHFLRTGKAEATGAELRPDKLADDSMPEELDWTTVPEAES